MLGFMGKTRKWGSDDRTPRDADIYKGRWENEFLFLEIWAGLPGLQGD